MWKQKIYPYMQNEYSRRRWFSLLIGIIGAYLVFILPLQAEEEIAPHHVTPATQTNTTIMPVDKTPAIRLRDAPTIKNLIPEL